MRISVGHVAGSRFQDIYPPAVQVLQKSALDLTEIVRLQKTAIAKEIVEKLSLEHHNVDK